MKTVIIYTSAYNCEKTLDRAINSVLHQTYSNIIYYICDNGSNDSTRDIIFNYANKDKRVIPILRDINHMFEANSLNPTFSFINSCLINNDYATYYLARLDGDDEYRFDFVEKMISFIEENELDVAACGSDFIDEQTNRIQGIRKLDKNLILRGANFNECFPVYYQFMRTTWAKIYRISLLGKCDFTNMNNVSYGADTIFALEAFRTASSVGILSESLHKYYVYSKSSSYEFDNNRINSDRILDDANRSFLIDKCGVVTPQNNHFLNVIYFNAIKDTLSVLLRAQISTKDKFSGLHHIFLSEHTQRLIAWNGYNEEKKQLFNAVKEWLLIQKENRKSDVAKLVAEILLVMYKDFSLLFTSDSLAYLVAKIPDLVEPVIQKDYSKIIKRLQSWYKRHDNDEIALTKLEIASYRALNKLDDELFTLFISINKSRPQSSHALNIDTQICKLIEKYPLLKNMSADLASAFPYVIRWVIKGNYKQALDAFISVQDIEINDTECETYILFAQNLSAAAENTDAYIYFKKIWISYLLDRSLVAEASKELDEFEQLLPNDEDFIELRKRLDNSKI